MTESIFPRAVTKGSEHAGEETGSCGKDKAGNHSHRRRKKDRQEHPFCALRLFSNRKTGRSTGPVHQGKENHTDRCNPRPAVLHKEGFHDLKIGKFCQRSL